MDKPLVIEPEAHEDARGIFYESFRRDRFERLVSEKVTFVQDNHSRSSGNVLRGLHYQIPPRAQGKLVRVVGGRVFDVAVDIRRSAPTFGEWFGIELTEENRKQVWIPPGFAHGFLALTDPADLVYKVTDYYSANHDRSIRWNDPDIGIEWPLDGEPILSDKDASAPFLAEAELFA